MKENERELKKDLLVILRMARENYELNKGNYLGDDYDAYISSLELSSEIDEFVKKYTRPAPSSSEACLSPVALAKGEAKDGPESAEDEWYCKSCRGVFITKNPKCCGEVVKFNVSMHGRELIGLSNAWIQVWQKWEHHPLVKQIGQEWAEANNYGAAGILNEAFDIMSKDHAQAKQSPTPLRRGSGGQAGGEG